MWDTAKPFLEQWLAERYAPQTLLKRLQQEAPFWVETLPRVPDLLIKSLQDREQNHTPASPMAGYLSPVMATAGVGSHWLQPPASIRAHWASPEESCCCWRG